LQVSRVVFDGRFKFRAVVNKAVLIVTIIIIFVILVILIAITA
jgi:hypothetical protein